MEQVRRIGAAVVIEAQPIAAAVACPDCGTPSTRVHARYQRSLRDAALAGQPVLIRLRVRRFVCQAAECARITFVEQVAGLTTPHARFSPPLRAMLTSIALALAGRAGARLSRALGMLAGRDTLLRLLRGLPDPDVGQVSMLGVDDFAVRRGNRYGTILIDLEAHRPIDVLPGRDSEPLAAWLQNHPEVQLICRDRAGAYADGARTGAPQAVQIADRWHLWRNLAEAIEATVIRHRAALAPPRPETTQTPPPSATPPQPLDTRLVVRTRERYAAVQQLSSQGASISGIARTLRLDRHTARRFARAADLDELLVKAASRITLLDAFKPYLHERFNAGHTDAAALYREIRTQGYRGSPQTVRRYLQPFRPAGEAPPPAPATPKIRDVTCWIMTKPDHLEPDDQQQLEQILARSPHLHAAAGHVRAFAAMMSNLAGHRLPDWLAAITADDLPALHSFVTGIRRDLAAVTAGLTLPHSSGPVEGHVNRIKMLKRQMYGRANFDLLRRRVLMTT